MSPLPHLLTFLKNTGLSLCGILILGGFFSGCASRGSGPNAAERYLAFAEEHPGARLRGETEKKAVEQISSYLSNLTRETVESKTRTVYADDAYFNDTLKTVRGAVAIEEYFLETLNNADEIQVEILDVAHSGSDYYLRWTMKFRAPAIAGGKPLRSIGITQIRFTPDGKVLLHQDYWDASEGLFEHLPIIGPAIRFLKSRL